MTLLPSRRRPAHPGSVPPSRHVGGRHSAEIPGGRPVAMWVRDLPVGPAGRHRATPLTRMARATTALVGR